MFNFIKFRFSLSLLSIKHLSMNYGLENLDKNKFDNTIAFLNDPNSEKKKKKIVVSKK